MWGFLNRNNELKYSGTRLIRQPKGPAKKCWIIRVVELTAVKCITKIHKKAEQKCRIIRIVLLTVVVLYVIMVTQYTNVENILLIYIAENATLKNKIASHEKNYELLLDELQQLKNTTQVNGAQKEQEEIPAKNEVVQKSEVVTKEGQLIPSAVLQSISRIENKV